MSALRVRLATDDECRSGSFIELCCDSFEVAVKLGALKKDRQGIAYVVGNHSYIVVAYCPFCGAPRKTADYMDRCGKCSGVHHSAKVCPQ